MTSLRKRVQVYFVIKRPVISQHLIIKICHNIIIISYSAYFSIVPEYKVVPVHHDRERRGISETKHYRLSAFDKDFHLELKPKYDVISPALEVVRKTSSHRWSKELYTPNGVFYQGHVTSDPNSHVAVREMMDDGRLVSVHQIILHFIT